MSASRPRIESARRCVESALTRIGRVFEVGALSALLAIVAVVLFQVLARYALPQSPAWTEELSRFLFVWCVVLASGAVLVRKRHVRIELFKGRLPKRTGLGFAVAGALLLTLFAGLILPSAWAYAANGWGQTSPALGLRMTWVFGSTVVFFGLVAVMSLLVALRDLLALFADGED